MEYSPLEILRAEEYVNKRYPDADHIFKRKMVIKALQIFNKKDEELFKDE